jgi:ribosomal protein S18 acetylase RimI-like enzyme
MPDLPPGYESRPVRPEGDVESILELCTAAAIAEHGVSDVDERMIREAYNLPSFEAETDSILILDAEGRAAAVTEFYDGDEMHVAPFLFLRVRPDLTGSEVSAAALAWAAERAPANAHLAPAGARVAMHTDLSVVNRPMIEALERAGWHHERTNWTMEIDLAAAAPLPEPAWPAGISVRSADLDRDARAIHEVEADSFSDHYGYVPQPFEQWFHFRTRFFKAEPELWILAMDGDQIAGMALCSSQRPGQPDLGWISTLGVRRPWRRRRLALAILHHAFQLLAARGKARAGLGVDAQSLTGATRLYEKAGMRVVREHLEYELLVRDGRDLRTLSLEPS